MTSPTKNKIKT